MASELYDISIKDKDGVTITVQEQEDHTALFGVHFKRMRINTPINSLYPKKRL